VCVCVCMCVSVRACVCVCVSRVSYDNVYAQTQMLWQKNLSHQKETFGCTHNRTGVSVDS
jgi:hypothetical protein